MLVYTKFELPHEKLERTGEVMAKLVIDQYDAVDYKEQIVAKEYILAFHQTDVITCAST